METRACILPPPPPARIAARAAVTLLAFRAAAVLSALLRRLFPRRRLEQAPAASRTAEDEARFGGERISSIVARLLEEHAAQRCRPRSERPTSIEVRRLR